MDVVTQWIRTTWTKQSRGGSAAARRNSAPIAFPIPADGLPLLHEVEMSEGDDFSPRFSARRELPDPARIALHQAGRLLSVELVPEPGTRPARWHRGSMVLLAPGQWLRWQINYRLTHLCDGAWSYRLDTLNLAYRPDPAVAFTGVPTRFLDERTRLA
ncbi:hypothetical protein [Actinoplanes sp. DH11]|uniref:hypothetical protein n=1 Tax=Actinoplanes sp. DH11 TaxID=2857011 RepID=UPI001E36627B|nr:hypothetical protein [Actinoplanes sp. DH11]